MHYNIYPDCTHDKVRYGWFAYQGGRPHCLLLEISLEFCDNSVKSRTKRHVTLYNII